MTTSTTTVAAARNPGIKPRNCAGCGRPPCKRGLVRDNCNACYHRHERAGTIVDLPRRNWPRADLVEEYLLLRRRDGHTRAQIADRMGISRTTLDQALRRAALAGDTRIDYQPRTAAAA